MRCIDFGGRGHAVRRFGLGSVSGAGVTGDAAWSAGWDATGVGGGVHDVVVLALTGVMDHGSAVTEGHLLMGRVAKLKQQARATARGRRIALDHDRAARDKRVEIIAAEAILALGARDDAAGQVRAAEVRVGDALRLIIAEGVGEAGAAQLCDLAVGEVRRFRRAAQTADHFGDGVDLAGPAGQEQGPSPDAGLPASSDARAGTNGIQAGQGQLVQPAATALAR